MLVLCRYLGQKLIIGDDIEVVMLGASSDDVIRIGIIGPDSTKISLKSKSPNFADRQNVPIPVKIKRSKLKP